MSAPRRKTYRIESNRLINGQRPLAKRRKVRCVTLKQKQRIRTLLLLLLPPSNWTRYSFEKVSSPVEISGKNASYSNEERELRTEFFVVYDQPLSCCGCCSRILLSLCVCQSLRPSLFRPFFSGLSLPGVGTAAAAVAVVLHRCPLTRRSR